MPCSRTPRRGNQHRCFLHYESHLPRLSADQMEYFSIHELCEVRPRLPKETTLKELGLIWIWMTMACGTTRTCGVCHHVPSSELHAEAFIRTEDTNKEHTDFFLKMGSIPLYSRNNTGRPFKKTFFPLGILPSLFLRIHTNPLALALDVFITQF